MAQEPLRIGLIGLGAIGQTVARLVAEQASDEIVIAGALVRDPGKPRNITGVPLVTTLEELLAADPAVVVEAGGHEALATYGPAVLRTGRDLLMVSVGVLARPAVYDAIHEAARDGTGRAFVASGAIGALDAIAAASLGGLERLTHTTRKPPPTLLPAGEAAALSQPREVFRGSARDGALRFPESINVAAAVSLAGLGLDRTEVCVIADPSVTRNHHEVVAEGPFGRFTFAIENVPSEENPRTGRLVALSLVRALLRRRDSLIVG